MSLEEKALQGRGALLIGRRFFQRQSNPLLMKLKEEFNEGWGTPSTGQKCRTSEHHKFKNLEI